MLFRSAYSRYGSFDQLAENNNKRINTILSELQKKTYKAGTIECRERRMEATGVLIWCAQRV